MDIHFSTDLPFEPELDPLQTTHILAISGEALSNAARHAQAREVQMTAGVDDGRLIITIEDNGRGFQENSAAGYGVRNMRDRARLLGGELGIASSPGQGTKITLTVPLEEE
jgi:two-component system sensor histidine kinase UhpB